MHTASGQAIFNPLKTSENYFFPRPTSLSRSKAASRMIIIGERVYVLLSLQTVISLRTALDSSREELRRLKEQQPPDPADDDSYGEAFERLALENHVLRRRLLGRIRPGEFSSSDAATSPLPQNRPPLADQKQSVSAFFFLSAMQIWNVKDLPCRDERNLHGHLDYWWKHWLDHLSWLVEWFRDVVSMTFW